MSFFVTVDQHKIRLDSSIAGDHNGKKRGGFFLQSDALGEIALAVCHRRSFSVAPIVSPTSKLMKPKELVRKGGFEPPRLSAPPPQDGVSASSTTSALRKLFVVNSLASSSCEGISDCTGFCTDFLHATRSSGRCKSVSRAKQLGDRSPSRMRVAHRGLDVIVSGDILQRKGVRGSSSFIRNVAYATRHRNQNK